MVEWLVPGAIGNAIDIVQEQTAHLRVLGDEQRAHVDDALTRLAEGIVINRGTAGPQPLPPTPPFPGARETLLFNTLAQPTAPEPLAPPVFEPAPAALEPLDLSPPDLSQLGPMPAQPNEYHFSGPARPTLNITDAPVSPGFDSNVVRPDKFIPKDVALPVEHEINLPKFTPQVLPAFSPRQIAPFEAKDLAAPTPQAGSFTPRDFGPLTLDLPGPFESHAPAAFVPTVVPDFVAGDIGTFDAAVPRFDAAMPSPTINWSEPAYASETYDLVLAQIKRWMEGGTGIPPAVEQALFQRARSRDEVETKKAVQDAFDTWAGRNFSMPPGMLVKQVNVAQEQGRAKAAETNRDIMVEAAKWEIESIRNAVTQGIALETLHMNLHENTVKRLFEVAKFTAESEISLFNAYIAVFNAMNQAYSVQAEVYKSRIEAESARVQVYKARIEAGMTAAQIYKAEVDAEVSRAEVYKKLVDAGMSKAQIRTEEIKIESVRADVFKTQVEADMVNASIFKTEIEAEASRVGVYRAQLEAEVTGAEVFKTQVEAEATRVQAYKAEVDAEGSKVQINSQMWDAYKIQQQAVLTGAEIYKTQILAWQSEIDVVRSRIEAYRTEVQAHVEKMSLEKLKIDAYDVEMRGEATRAGAFEASTRAYAATVQAVSTKGDLLLREHAARMEAAKVRIQELLAQVDQQKSRNDVTLKNYQVNLDSYRIQGDLWKTQAEENMSVIQRDAQHEENLQRTDYAYVDLWIKKYQNDLAQATREAEMALEATKAMGNLSAQMAAGAMSALHVSAGITGSGSETMGVTNSLSEIHSYSR